MKKTVSVILLFCLLCALLSGCGGTATVKKSGLSIVATIFPLWDWTRNLVYDREDVTLTLLLDQGVDMHSYQPTMEDIVRMNNCDLFIYVGGESDAWVEEALKGAANRDMVTVNLMEVLGDAARTEETVEGMQSSGEEEDAYDEHIWLSPRNALVCCEAITEALAGLLPEKAGELRRNGSAYGASLESLDESFRRALEGRARNTLLFADRFPFRYLLADYGIEYYAAFSGCEAETEASFETITFLAAKVDELGLPVVLTTEFPVPRLAETVVENTRDQSADIEALDSMQSARIEDDYNYLSRMETNLEILRQALN